MGLALVALTSFSTPPARAQLLINPTGGTVVFNDSQNYDDSVSLQSLPFAFSFFGGTPTNSIYVSTNGNLNFNGTNSPSNVALPSSIGGVGGPNGVCGLWDDLYIYSGTGEAITSQSTSGYYAVTYSVNTINQQDAANRQVFQIALFGTSVTVSGFAFTPGDIALSYQKLAQTFQGNDATIGLNGVGGAFVPLPGTTNGLITSASPDQRALLPTTGNRFVLFHPNGQGGYTASIASAPEPTQFAAFDVGILSLAGLALRVRRRGRCSS